MKPARIEFDAQGVAHAPDFGDVYHPRSGSAAQARQVFLAGNGLPARWAGRADFTILETGFGLGQNFLATWAAWRADPARPARLHYAAVDAHPPAGADLARGLASSPWPDLADALRTAWPPLATGLHALDFDGGAVQLLLAWGEVGPMVRELDLQADAFFLDGFAPDRNPSMWEPALMQALARRAAPGATAATWTVARVVRDGLRAAGFEVERVAGAGEKRETLRARFAPGFSMRQPPPRGTPRPGRALVIGAGLAGAWAARALARQGLTVTVLDRHAVPAQEASGNPAGLFHGTAHADAGTHALWNEAAALQAARVMSPMVDAGDLPGAVQGLLRLAQPGQDPDAMQTLAARHGWPPDLVQALPAAEAARRAGVGLDRAAWWFPQGGWVSPARLVERLLQGVDCRLGIDAHAIRREDGEWQVLDAQGRVIDAAPALVLANGADAARLWPAAAWPLGRSRGQVAAGAGRRAAAGCPAGRCRLCRDAARRRAAVRRHGVTR